MQPAGPLLLRLVLTTVLVAHGAHGLFGAFETPNIGPGGLSARAAGMAAAGLTPGVVFATLGSLLELAGGALVAIGFLTRPAAAAVAAYEALLLWKAAWPWGFFLNWVGDPARGHGVEFGLLLIGGLLCLCLGGAGEWSFDGRRDRDRATRAAGRARLRAK